MKFRLSSVPLTTYFDLNVDSQTRTNNNNNNNTNFCYAHIVITRAESEAPIREANWT